MTTTHRLSLLPALFVGVFAVACTTTVIQRTAPPAPADSDPDASEPDPGQTPDPEPDGGKTSFVFKPAPKGTFPQAVSLGGSVVASPKLVPIVFASDPQKQTIIDFTAKLATSTYWSQIASEYGVGALTVKTPIVLSQTPAATIDDSQIESWLKSQFTSDAAHFGTPDPDTLYAIFYPPGTTITQGQFQGAGSSCEQFGGYHYETNVQSVEVGYAVIPRCASFAGLGGADVTTFSASHEILEWATDPFPASNPAYTLVDDDHAVWDRIFLGELGDLCTQMGDVGTQPADLGFKVQRTWSNASMKAGHHPCAPVPKTPYVTAFPTTAMDSIPATNYFGQELTTRGYQVGVGESKTIDLMIYSDADVGNLQIQVVDLTTITGASPEFSYKLDRTTGNPGDTVKLTIKGLKSAVQGQGFMIITQTSKNYTLFPVALSN